MKLLFLFLFVLITFSSSAQALSTAHKKAIMQFVSHVKKGEVEQLAEKVSYPLSRSYPLPDIKNQAQFIKRYREVFDGELVKQISQSDVNNDWSLVGWRGLMFNNGDVWLDEDGNLTTVNYESAAEKQLRKELIAEDKRSIHASLRQFESPMCVMETTTYRIRIDYMGDGNYRYASWKKTQPMSAQPDLILTKGECFTEGTGGNHRYVFKNGEYVYTCSIIVMGEGEQPPATLEVHKNRKQILFHKVVNLNN